jgi:hypothetical protein
MTSRLRKGKKNKMKIIEAFKNNTAYTMIVVAMGWSFHWSFHGESLFKRSNFQNAKRMREEKGC